MKHRTQNKLRAKKRYKRMRVNPAFKRHQHLYRANPSRFKRFASASGFVPIPFWTAAFGVGAVVGANADRVYYALDTAPDTVRSVFYQDLLDSAVFLEDRSIDCFFNLLDAATETPVAVSAVSDAIVRAVEDDDGYGPEVPG